MPTEIGPLGQVFDVDTGRLVGFVDKLGREQLVPSFFTAFTSVERTVILQRANNDPLRKALLGLVEASTISSVPAPGYVLALRASQKSNANPIDFSPAENVLALNGALFPVKWVPNGFVATGERKSSVGMNGAIYRCKIGGGANGPVEPIWPTTVGAEVVSGANTYVCEKGPWFVDESGTRLFRTLPHTQLGAPGSFSLPSQFFNWDLATESLIINVRTKFNYANSGQPAVGPLLSTRNFSGSNCGVRLLGTGGGLNDIRIQLRDRNNNAILTDDTSPAFTRKPLDGQERSTTILIDSLSKMMWTFAETIPITPADMYNGGLICPNGLSIAGISGSTLGDDLVIGGNPGDTTSIECAFRSIDVIKVPGGLPGNIQNIASFFARGGDALLPHSLAH